MFFGRILFVNRVLGITQGSPVSPGLADMVLSVAVENNSVMFTFEARRWLTFIVRWIDDIWIAVVCFLSRDFLIVLL